MGIEFKQGITLNGDICFTNTKTNESFMKGSVVTWGNSNEFIIDSFGNGWGFGGIEVISNWTNGTIFDDVHIITTTGRRISLLLLTSINNYVLCDEYKYLLIK